MSLFGKKITACPFCYNELNMKKVAFRCSQRGQPGRPPCQDTDDPKRRIEFKDSKPVPPVITLPGSDPDSSIDLLAAESAVCPSCGGESKIRICPACHSRLPRSLEAGSPLFGLVGLRFSGKTVLLTVLHKHLKGKVARRFDASIITPGGSSGLARDLERNEQAMLSGEHLPGQTEQSGGAKQEPAVYEWKGSTKGSGTIFSFYDNAGEDVKNEDVVTKQKYLAQVSGVMLLLDPFAFPENREVAKSRRVTVAETDPEAALDGITSVLQHKRNRKVKTPLAVVVPKIDAFFDQVPANNPIRRNTPEPDVFDEQDSLDVHDNMVSLIERWGGDNLIRQLRANYENFRVFGVSALGAEPEYGEARVNSRGLLPHRVADPLLWLLAEHRVIPKSSKK
ncbi:hypothetical protein [Brevibacterium aurantiacum]|uniref:Zinc ribbon domain-containing protein n=1 Tax=Brevibacterium aurantiacum TaxID=273384 RepID=A0A2A3YQU2_BREAU|nr:hypothetical protein [Brevibacterium aurantiacum]MDN5585784.1 hypothetical protein [Brevibacterium sp.]PCC41475.1 hypothetical protein CIK65_17430 [Brevibacterium aurantiacum]SMX94868.1 hypothetical protein BAUR920_02816 [Brevibacterium aurantiacum]